MTALDTSSFPTALREHMGERKRTWRGLWGRWEGAPKTPLRVTAQLATGFVPGIDSALHLDGILSAACMTLFASDPASNNGGELIVPLPLQLVWVCQATRRPLWAATDMSPSIDAPNGVSYIHGRHPEDRSEFARPGATNTKAGRFKDTRIPMRVIAATEVVGWCVGIKDEVARLLDRIDNIGKKPSIGHGRVARWIVEDDPGISIDYIMERRPVPLSYLCTAGVSVSASRIARRGWTPPYWLAASHTDVRMPWTH